MEHKTFLDLSPQLSVFASLLDCLSLPPSLATEPTWQGKENEARSREKGCLLHCALLNVSSEEQKPYQYCPLTGVSPSKYPVHRQHERRSTGHDKQPAHKGKLPPSLSCQPQARGNIRAGKEPNRRERHWLPSLVLGPVGLARHLDILSQCQ